MRQKMMQFMQGRYGTDTLNKHLLVLAMILVVLSMFLRSVTLVYNFLTIAIYVILGINIWRTFSRNIYARYNENQRYTAWFNNMSAPWRRHQNLRNKRKADPANAYFRCPSCGQMVRVPKGRGKITITCPKCRREFSKRT